MATEERPPAVAGAFYPGDPEELRATVRALLAGAPAPTGPAPKALIAPHAGYPYSGRVAARAYARIRAGAPGIERVVLMGPSHFVPFPGIALPEADFLRIPTGRIPVDRTGCEDLPRMAGPHAREHSLETQLPFLRELLGEAAVVPLVVGRAGPEETGRVLERLWGGPETLVVISSDLSHFHDDEDARARDRRTAEAIERLRYDGIGPEDACGFQPVNGLLWLARRRGYRPTTLELATSADAGAPAHRVVGYGAFAAEAAA